MAISAIEPESNWIKNRDCFLVFEISINRFYYMIFVHKIHDINLLTATLQYSITTPLLPAIIIVGSVSDQNAVSMENQ